MKRLKLALIVLVMGLIGTLGVAPANSQTLWFGGRIWVTATSDRGVSVSGNLVYKNGAYRMLAPIRQVAPGSNSRKMGIYDTDAFYAPRGCSTTAVTGRVTKKFAAGRVHKINDMQSYTLHVNC